MHTFSRFPHWFVGGTLRDILYWHVTRLVYLTWNSIKLAALLKQSADHRLTRRDQFETDVYLSIRC